MTAELLKVGPHGYIHGWIKVGPGEAVIYDDGSISGPDGRTFAHLEQRNTTDYNGKPITVWQARHAADDKVLPGYSTDKQQAIDNAVAAHNMLYAVQSPVSSQLPAKSKFGIPVLKNIDEHTKDVLLRYRMSGYEDVNHALRTGEGADDYETKIITGPLDQLFSRTPPLSESLTTWRTVRSSFADENLKPGSSFTDKGYSSTTPDRSDLADSAGWAQLKITVQPGVKVVDLGHYLGGSENDVVLNRGTTFHVTGIQPDGTLEVAVGSSVKTSANQLPFSVSDLEGLAIRHETEIRQWIASKSQLPRADDVIEYISRHAVEKAAEPPEPPQWPGWQRDLQLIKAYATQVGVAFNQAIQVAQRLIQQWWDGTLTTTRQGLVAAIRSILETHLGQVLTNLWTEAWHLGDTSAQAVIAKLPDVDWGDWEPGDPAAARLIGSGDRLNALLNSYGVTTIKAVANTNMDRLAEEIGNAVADGDSADSLSRRLPQILNVPGRADMIARTEVARAVSAATMSRYMQTGITRKSWLVAPDERVCPLCRGNEAAGAIPTSALFPSGVPAAPGHPNCRCAVAAAEVEGVNLDDPDTILSDAIAAAAVPDLVKVGPEGYIHGFICVRPPCGEKPGKIKAADLAVQRDGGIVHRQSGYSVGHVARNDNGSWVVHHADGTATTHSGARTEALKAVARRYNSGKTQSGMEEKPSPVKPAVEPVTEKPAAKEPLPQDKLSPSNPHDASEEQIYPLILPKDQSASALTSGMYYQSPLVGPRINKHADAVSTSDLTKLYNDIGFWHGHVPDYADVEKNPDKYLFSKEMGTFVSKDDDLISEPYWKRVFGDLTPVDKNSEQESREKMLAQLASYWQVTESGRSPELLAMQRAARDEFGLDDAEVAKEENNPDVDKLYTGHGAVFRGFMRAQYDATQEQLKKQGITSIKLYRGMRFASPSKAPKWLRDGDGLKSGAVSPKQRAVSSWTTNPLQADTFARGKTPTATGKHGVALTASVPASRIFSTPQTGFGEVGQSEITVLHTSGTIRSKTYGPTVRKELSPDIAKVGPEGYIHGYICVRPPCGKEPDKIDPKDLWFRKKDGAVIHAPSGYQVGSFTKDAGTFTITHHDGSQVYSGPRKGEAQAAMAAHHNALSGTTTPKTPLKMTTSGGYTVEVVSTEDKGQYFSVTDPHGFKVPLEPWNPQSHAEIRTTDQLQQVLAREGQDYATLAEPSPKILVPDPVPEAVNPLVKPDVKPAVPEVPKPAVSSQSVAPLAEDPPQWMQDGWDRYEELDDQIEKERDSKGGFTPRGNELREEQGHIIYGNPWVSDDDPGRYGLEDRARDEGVTDGTRYRAILLATNKKYRTHFAAENGMTPDSADAKMTSELKDTLAGRRVSTRVTNGGLAKILSSGNFETQFETSRSGGLKSNEVRAKLEAAQFGYPEDLDPSLRPYYAYMDEGYDRPAGSGSRYLGEFGTDDLSMFGTTQVVFKDSVKNRTTFNVGDSMDNKYASIPSRLSDPQPQSFAAFGKSDGGMANPGVLKSMNRDYNGSKFRSQSFIEAQVHSPDGKSRPLTTGDIDHIVFPATPPAAVRGQLADKNIPWTVSNAKTIAKTGTQEEKNRTVEMYQQDLEHAEDRISWLTSYGAEFQQKTGREWSGLDELTKVQAAAANLQQNISVLQQAGAV